METLRYVVLANGLLAVVSMAFYVLLRRETFFGANRLALWLGLTASLVLPLLELPDWRPQPVKTVMQRTARAIVPKVLPSQSPPQPDVTIAFPNGRTYPAFQKQAAQSGWSWQQGAIGLYIAVLLFLLIRFRLRVHSLMRLIRQSTQEPYDDFTLVSNASVTSPFSFFGWVVLNPDHHAPDELDQILRHERVHVRERHSIDMIAAELVSIVFWFNPAAYLFRQLVHQTLEFSADRAVLAEGIDLKSYQYHLVKVSLSSGQSAITNHFSQSQLKSRIVMLNKPNSAPSTWLKYPVLCIAALTVVSTFARPQLKTLKKYVPASVLATVIDAEPMDTPAQEITIVPQQKQSKAASKQMPIVNGAIPADTVLQLAVVTKPDSAQKSPSRYMQYEGDKLYWIVTPKTSFDDLAIMKQEFARHGYKMQVQTLKYDPLNTYITEIKVTIIRPVVGISDFEDTGVEGKPIRSYGGYNGLNTLKTVAVVGSYPFNDDFLHIPQELVQIARSEELSMFKFINDEKLETLIAEGQRKYGYLGMGFRRFDKGEIKKQSRPNSAISIKADDSIVINENPGRIIKAFINNEPVSLNDVQKLKLTQLYTVAVILGYNSAMDKRTGTDYLFFYINEDN